MKKILPVILAIVTLGTAQAEIAISPFIKANVGYSLVLDDVEVDFTGSETSSLKDPDYGSIEADDSAVYGASIGLNFNQIIEVEFEYAHAEYDFIEQSAIKVTKVVGSIGVLGGKTLPLGGVAKINTYMANFKYIFNENGKFHPYILVGLGVKDIEGTIKVTATPDELAMTNTETDDNGNGLSRSVDDTAFAYQGGIGMKYILNKNIYIDASYRYQDSEDFAIPGFGYGFSNHNFVFGVAYQW